MEQPQIESWGWFWRSIRQRSRSSSRSVPPVSASSGSQCSRRRRSQATFSCLIQTRVEFTPRRIGRYRPLAISPLTRCASAGMAAAKSSRLASRASRFPNTCRRSRTASGRRAGALREVGENRFPGSKKEASEDVPGTDEEPIGADERVDSRALALAFLEIVLDRDGLAVEREGPEVGIALEDIQQARHHRDEPRAVSLESFVPLAVPVRVWDHEGAPAKTPANERDGPRREDAEHDADGHAAEHVERVMNADDDARERRGAAEQENRHGTAR